jgi:hypothetical protein
MKTEERYEQVINTSGIVITVCEGRFEVICREGHDVNEQYVVLKLREWLEKHREKKL